MQPHYIITFLLFFAVSYTHGQEQPDELIKKAWSLYENKQYTLAGQTYNQAIAILPQDAPTTAKQINTRFNAACAWSLAKNKEEAFGQLFVLANQSHFDNPDQLRNDTDLQYLYADQRWNELLTIVDNNYEKVRPLNKEELKVVFDAYQKSYKKLFASGSTIGDIDSLYHFYTQDFVYNHPKYGGNYSRELLYNNTLKYHKKGAYNNSPARTITNVIYGLNAVIFEFIEEGSTDKMVTLMKFRKDKIYYIEEFW